MKEVDLEELAYVDENIRKKWTGGKKQRGVVKSKREEKYEDKENIGRGENKGVS